jgi:ribulose bisphosphate carboxylase small subunit
MRRIGFVLVIPLLALSACSASTEATALDDCQKAAPRAVIDLRGIDSFETAEFSDVKAERRGEGDSWDVTGTVTLKAAGDTIAEDFRCLAQNVDGKSYANIIDVSGTDVRPTQ